MTNSNEHFPVTKIKVSEVNLCFEELHIHQLIFLNSNWNSEKYNFIKSKYVCLIANRMDLNRR